MNRFNLTFSGEILAGHDPARVKLHFGKMFAIDDPVRLERFFSGQTIILRRNLERKAAAQYYHELHLLGMVAALVKVTASEAADAVVNTPASPTKKMPGRSPRNKMHIAAQPKSRKAASLRLAAEKETRDRALLAEQKRRKEEEAAQREAAAVEARRVAAEERARRTAERARQKAEQAAKRRLELEAKKRREAEEAARRQAELEATKRREAEEAARLQAELEEIKRQKAEEAARLQAEREEIKRQEAEEAARLQAELEEIKRQEAEEAARVKAEAQRKEAEAQRKSAERRRAAAEQLAAAQALRKEEKRKAIARKAEQKAQKAQQIRQQAEEAARHKAERLNKEAQERLEQAALSEALQEKAVQRGAAELAQQTTFKPARARVKTRLETPQRKTGQPVEVGTPGQHKRQSGEPNLYKLRPFRNTEEVRNRAAHAHSRMRLSYTLGALAMAALLLASGVYVRQTVDPVITGANAVAIDPRSGPLLLAGNALLLHDRAGIGTKEVPISALGLSAMEAPLAFDSSGALLALGRLTGDSADAAGGTGAQLLRCELAASTCRQVSPELQDRSIGAFVIHPLDGSLLLADTAAGELLKVDREGKIVARASAPVPDHPVLRLHGGLLLMNSADGPGISVLRYEDSAFGQQLDEILLLPPAAQKADQSRVGDFLWSGNSWWASLRNPESGSIGLYRFDEQWNYLKEVALPGDVGPLQLSSWGAKTLVSDPRHPPIQRFNAQAAVEAPFVSSQLADLVAGQQRHARLGTVAWRGGLSGCVLTAVAGFGFGYLQSLRKLVYKTRREHGAEPVDDYADALHWIAPVANRQALLRRRCVSYGLLGAGILLLTIAQGLTSWQLAALLLALSGPAIALLLLLRSPVGHIGIVQDKLLLVDHHGMYHLGGGSSVQYCGPFLMIDDVVVFCGSQLLPAFPATQIQQLVRPLALGGVKVDRNTVLVKLLQCRHPLAQGGFAIVAMAAAAAIPLCLHGIF